MSSPNEIWSTLNSSLGRKQLRLQPHINTAASPLSIAWAAAFLFPGLFIKLFCGTKHLLGKTWTGRIVGLLPPRASEGTELRDGLGWARIHHR